MQKIVSYVYHQNNKINNQLLVSDKSKMCPEHILDKSNVCPFEGNFGWIQHVHLQPFYILS